MDSSNPFPRGWDLTRIVLGVMTIGGLVLASFWVVKPFLLAAIWATMIVVSTWPTLLAVQARLWGRRSLAVLVMTMVMPRARMARTWSQIRRRLWTSSPRVGSSRNKIFGSGRSPQAMSNLRFMPPE